LNRFLDSEYTRELGDGSEENSASVRLPPTSFDRPRFFLVVWQGEHWETEEFPSPCDGKTTIPCSGPPMELSDTCEPTGLALCRPDCFGVTFGETPDILHIHFHVKHMDPSQALGHALPTSQNLNYSKQEAPNAQNYVRITSLHKQQSAGRSSRAKGGHRGRSPGCSPYVFSLLMQLPKEDSLSRFSPIPVVLLKTILLLFFFLLFFVCLWSFFTFHAKEFHRGKASNKAHQLLRSLILRLSSSQCRGGRGESSLSNSFFCYLSSSSGLFLLQTPSSHCSHFLTLGHILLRHITFSRELFLILTFPWTELQSTKNRKSARIARQRRQSASEKTLCFALFLQKLNSSLVTY
jgi:hypothetical protein